jgi:hypothetical protein
MTETSRPRLPTHFATSRRSLLYFAPLLPSQTAHRYEHAVLRMSHSGNDHQAFSEILILMPRSRRWAAALFYPSAVQHA